MNAIEGSNLGGIFKPAHWEHFRREGINVLQRLVDLPMPVIGVVNGPVTVRSEYLLLTDIHLASERATYGDFPHPAFGITAGDGLQVVREEAVGPARAKWLLWTDEAIDARTAERLNNGESSMRCYHMSRRSHETRPSPTRWPQNPTCTVDSSARHSTSVCSVALPKVSPLGWPSKGSPPLISPTRSIRTGATRAVNTVAAYLRSARAFCNWLVQRGYVSETSFPPGAVPAMQRGCPQVVEPEAFIRLVHAYQFPGSPGGPRAGMTARNRAILWLLWDTGLQVSELCRLRLTDVDRTAGSVTVPGKGGQTRTFLLSADGQRALDAYLEQARLTPAWEPAIPETRDRLWLTEQRRPLTKNCLTSLFARLNQRARFTMNPICSSMRRDTYAIRFLQAGGNVLSSKNNLDSLISHLPSATSAFVTSSGERNSEPRRLPGKPSLHSQPGGVKASARRRKDEDELEMFLSKNVSNEVMRSDEILSRRILTPCGWCRSLTICMASSS